MLEFQTASSVGVLLYLQGSVYADFIALQIKAGKLVFSYNLGSGRVDIESEHQYNDGMKHTVWSCCMGESNHTYYYDKQMYISTAQVKLWRLNQHGEMLIDNGTEYLNGSSPGTYTALNINNGYLFLGGIPNFINYVSLFMRGEEVR